VKCIPHNDVTLLHDLTKSELKAEHWNTQEGKAEQVRDEEGGTTVLEAEIWESPQVTKTDSATD
jgi:hypothetical protein